MAEPLRVALIGLRGINVWHYLPAILRNPHVRLVAGVDPATTAHAPFREKANVPLYTDFDAMLAAHGDIEAVLIGTPNHIHLPNVKQAAAAGLHMMVTKPLTNTVAECRAAIDAARAAGVILQVGQEYRFRGCCRAMLEMVRDRSRPLGDVTLMVSHMGHAGGLGNLTGAGTWRSNPANVPGGCANLLGVHPFDLANAVFGTPRTVSARLEHRLAQAPLEDTVAVTIGYDTGVAVVTDSYISPAMDFTFLAGSAANLFINRNDLRFEAKEDKHDVDVSKRPGSADVLLAELVAAVREGKAVETPGQAGLEAVAVLEAALLSAARGAEVKIAELEGV